MDEGVSESTQPTALKRLKHVSSKQNCTSSEAHTEKTHPEPPGELPAPQSNDDGRKWERFEHNGVMFPENWQRHGVSIHYHGSVVELDEYQEEIATYWAQGIGTEWHTKTFYRENFQRLFLSSFDPTHPLIVAKQTLDFELFDFTPLVKHIESEKSRRETLTREEKQKTKEDREALDRRFKYIIVDGRLEKISNFKIEPPTLFKGRGEHPKMGSLKQRIMPEDVELNLSKDALVPICHLPGRSWGDVSFQNDAAWVATYMEPCTGNRKYALLSASSKIKFENDIKKYERARRLKNCIETVRADYKHKMKHGSPRERQMGTATYFIDYLAIRVGNEKKEDEADTVGCCSLRKEHVRLEGDNTITLDFLGKDSMRYLNTIKVEPIAYQNLEEFLKGKEDSDNIFDLIKTNRLNEYLQTLMEELTAKVFRTYNASNTLQNELAKSVDLLSPEDTLEKKLEYYNEANRQVAILCNHQKGVNKNFDASLSKHEEKLEEMRAELRSFGKKGQNTSKAEKLRSKIEKAEKAIETRQKNKSIALGTSKTNYNDPRISVAWCKKYEVPIEKIFTSVLLEKFAWAMSCESSWQF
jgi:DNA topoisomerase-1